MTLSERNDLEDMLDQVRIALENAECLMDVLTSGYFERFDPEEKTGEFSIVFDFKRNRSFARLLQDSLVQIKANLPCSNWVQTLQTE